MSEAARALYDQLRALESRAVRAQGRRATRREAVRTASRPPYNTPVTSQRVSSWLPEEPSRAQVPSTRFADEVWALVCVWSDWAGDKQPNRNYWDELIEKAQPPRIPRARGNPLLPGGPAVPEVRYSLPPDVTVFTGRGEELDQITAAVPGMAGAGGAVTVRAIEGMPGAGKTALAVHAAHLLREKFPDRQLFIDLHGHTPGREPVLAEHALAGLLAATGVDPRFLPNDPDGRAAMWRDKMAGQRVLLVLDNAASSSQVAPLLPGAGGCLVLVTSRRHLGDLPGAVVPVQLGVLPPQHAAELFTRVVPRAADRPGGVAEMALLAGYLPLAISLLARVFAKHRSWTLANLATETRAGLLGLAAENNTIAAAFEVSYRHLDPNQQRFFRLLGLHPGATIDTYAAAALAGASVAEAARLLDGLYGEGLVTETGYRRYGMHDLLRMYARDHAEAKPADESQRALARLLDYYQHMAGRAGARLARQNRPGPVSAAPIGLTIISGLEDAQQALEWARADRASLLGCLDHATGNGQHARVIGLTAGLAGLWRLDGPWGDAITRHTAAIRAARHLGDRLGEAGALTDLSEVRQLTGDFPGAAQALEQALSIYRDLGDRLGQANAHHGVGVAGLLIGDFPGAGHALGLALDIYRDLGDRLGQANTFLYLANVRKVQGDYPGATHDYEQALGIYRDLGNRLGQANALAGRGDVRRLTTDYPGATHDYEQGLGIYRDLGNRLGQAMAQNGLGIVQRLTGDYPGSAQALEQTLDIYRSLGYRLGQAGTLTDLGIVRRLTGDFLGAARALEQALSLYRDLGDREGAAETLNERGTLHRDIGELTRAEECHQEALELARAITSPQHEACGLAGLGRCAGARGRTAQAEILLRQAHQILQQIGAADARDVLADLNALTAPRPEE